MRFWLLSLCGLSHLGWHGARGFSPVILLSLDVAFSTPPPLCPELCTFPHIKNAVYTAQIYTAKPLQTYPSLGLCVLQTVPFQPASSSGLVLYW